MRKVVGGIVGGRKGAGPKRVAYQLLYVTDTPRDRSIAAAIATNRLPAQELSRRTSVRAQSGAVAERRVYCPAHQRGMSFLYHRENQLSLGPPGYSFSLPQSEIGDKVIRGGKPSFRASPSVAGDPGTGVAGSPASAARRCAIPRCGRPLPFEKSVREMERVRHAPRCSLSAVSSRRGLANQLSPCRVPATRDSLSCAASIDAGDNGHGKANARAEIEHSPPTDPRCCPVSRPKTSSSTLR